MLGPLPPLYRVIVCVLAFVASVGLGIWLAWQLPESSLSSAGTGLGAGLGIVVVLLLLHDAGDSGDQGDARAPRS